MVQKICNYFGEDGLLHIICSSLIVGIANIFLPLWIAIIIAFTIGVAKEIIWDKLLNKGTCDNKDIVADLIGIILGCL